SLPTRVVSCGGRLGYDDDGNTANTQIALYDYGDQQLIFEVRGLVTGPYRTATVGVVFHAEHGYLVIGAYNKAVVFDHDGQVVRTFEGGGNHFQNFLDAVRAGDAGVLESDGLEGHLSSALCHLGNISYRLGRPQSLSATDRPFGDEPDANESFDRFRGHLIDNGLDPSRTSYAMGPSLRFDPGSERFAGDRAEEANALLRRPGRGAFVVPASV
ncbi:MAG: Gfo/Idh/MocA family protein, partial [Planctomycetota bacterium]